MRVPDDLVGHAHAGLPTVAVVDPKALRKACRRAGRAPRPERTAIVRPIVAVDPEGAWELLRRWLREATSQEAVYELWPVLLSILDLDERWEAIVAPAVVDDARLADCLAVALADDPTRFDRLVSRDQLVETWIRYRTGDSDWDFWPLALVYEGTHRWGAEGIWRLVADIAERCDDPELLVMLGELHLDELVYLGSPSAIEYIEREASRSANLRQALWYVNVDDLADDLAARIERLAEPPPGPARRS